MGREKSWIVNVGFKGSEGGGGHRKPTWSYEIRRNHGEFVPLGGDEGRWARCQSDPRRMLVANSLEGRACHESGHVLGSRRETRVCTSVTFAPPFFSFLFFFPFLSFPFPFFSSLLLLRSRDLPSKVAIFTRGGSVPAGVEESGTNRGGGESSLLPGFPRQLCDTLSFSFAGETGTVWRSRKLW